jgi:hypothetical protein
VGPRAGLDGRKISSPLGFDPGPSSPQSVAIPTELPGPPVHIYGSNLFIIYLFIIILLIYLIYIFIIISFIYLFIIYFIYLFIIN